MKSADLRLLARALPEVLRAHLALRLFPAIALDNALDRAEAKPLAHPTGDPQAQRIAKTVRALARRVPGSTCLVEALAVCRLLQADGYPARLRIGVRRDGPESPRLLHAHAWVELEDGIVVGRLDGLASYSPLATPLRSDVHPTARELVVALLSHDRIRRVWPANASARDVWDICESEELFGLVHDEITTLGEHEQWPRVIRDDLWRRCLEATARELINAEEVRDVLATLASSGVRPVLFKGTALAYGTYRSPFMRPRCDTDLFVPRSQIEEVRRVLSSRGYQKTRCADGDFVHRQFEMHKRDRLGLLHAFDFHWAISTQIAFADLLTYDELAAGSVPLPSLGESARGAGGVHALLIGCVHPVMHHRNEERLLWLYDIHLSASGLTGDQFQRFAELAMERKVGAICAAALERSREVFRTPVPDAILATLRDASGERSAAYLRPGRFWLHEQVANLRALSSWSDRARLVGEVLFPNRRYILDIYQLSATPLTSLLLPALYAHRNVRGLWDILHRRK
jgi:Uncharacterised nucleotidyltransferase/Transglutaminase-like superfamily